MSILDGALSCEAWLDEEEAIMVALKLCNYNIKEIIKNKMTEQKEYLRQGAAGWSVQLSSGRHKNRHMLWAIWTPGYMRGSISKKDIPRSMECPFLFEMS